MGPPRPRAPQEWDGVAKSLGRGGSDLLGRFDICASLSRSAMLETLFFFIIPSIFCHSCISDIFFFFGSSLPFLLPSRDFSTVSSSFPFFFFLSSPSSSLPS